MTEDLRPYNLLCSVSNRVSLSQIRCHPDDTSDRNLRLTRALHEPSGVSGLGKTKVLRYQGKLGLLKSQSTG